MNKNLKRVLSGAMASSMLVGMMATGASAAVADQFSDAEKIVNTNAVDTLVALNIINGKDDGTFDPTAVVTRASMAKMLTIALNGGKEPVLPTNATPTFSDIKGHWAESYIEYCTSLGIIAGRGDGTFDPDATVTGSEAAKMMLVAMGYPADIYGFTGSAWAINVGVEANKAKLFDGIESVDASAGLSRDNTAQLIYNGVLADTMYKTPSQVIGGDTTWDYKIGGDSIFEEKYDGLVYIATMEGNSNTINGLKDGQIQLKNGALDHATKTATATTAKFTSDFDISNIGEEVKVLFKDGNGGITNTPDEKDTIYGVFNTGKTNVIWGTMGDVGSQKSSDAKIKIDGVKYNTVTKDANGNSKNVSVVYNYDVTNENKGLSATDGSSTSNSSLTKALLGDNGNTIKAVCDSDGYIETIYVVKSELSYVTSVSDEKVTLKGIGTLKFEDHDIVEGLEKDDVVVITTLYKENGYVDATQDGAFCIVEKAEVVSGTIDGYKDAETVTVDGETYTLHNNVLYDLAFSSDKQTGTNFYGKVGETFDLYLVNGYVAGAIQTSEDANNYSVVIDADNALSGNLNSTFNSLKIQVLTADGTKVILTPNEDSRIKNADGTYTTCTTSAHTGQLGTVGAIVTWTGDEDDATVTLEYAYTVTSGSYKYVDKTKTLDGKVVAGDAVLYFKNTSTTKYKAYDLRSLDDVNDISKYVLNDDGKVVAAWATGTSYPNGAMDDTVYGIISKYNNTVKIDGDEYYCYTVENDTDSYTVNIKKATNPTVKKGSLVYFNPTSDDLYNANDISDMSANATKGWVKEFDESDDTLSVYLGVDGYDKDGKVETDTSKIVTWTGKNLNTYALDDDCVIVYVNTDDNCAGDEIGINEFDHQNAGANVYFKVDTDNLVIAIMVETSGEGF